MKVTESIRDLYVYDTGGMKLWQTPGSGSAYWAARPQWQDDYVIARPEDFATAQGWTDFGWEDMEDDDLEWDDKITIELKW